MRTPLVPGMLNMLAYNLNRAARMSGCLRWEMRLRRRAKRRLAER